MDWLKNFIKNNPLISLALPTSVNFFTFFGNLAVALSDGYLDGNEVHQLISGASGVEALILLIIMMAMRDKKKK